MLIEFSVENYKSIKERITLSLQAAKDTKLAKNITKINLPQIDNQKTTQRILKTSVIYGANASGKSNILKAMDCIKKIIRTSHNYITNQQFPIDNFRLDLSYTSKPTMFEFIFIQHGIKYAYQVSLTKEKVLEENLYYWPNGRQVKIFERDEEKIILGNSFKGKNQEDDLRNKIYAQDTAENTLFLSRANNVNIVEMKEAFNWFATKLVIIYQQIGIGNATSNMIADNILNEQEVLNCLKIADPQIADFNLVKKELEDVENHPMNLFIKQVILPQIAKKENIRVENLGKILGLKIDEKTRRYAITETGERILVDFDLSEESDGTQRYYGLLGPILACLKTGCTLLFDEMELRLHPLLSKGLIDLFTSELNSQNAQLIITSHDVNLLDYKGLFRRDQIWFTEKNEDSSTELYSLDDFTGIRDSMIQSKNYLKGKFGAIPDLNWENLND
ncbi:MAG: ATP-binding protein [Fusobacterium sp.]|nr:ATP-binding protein [Fusobacterium sp.]